MERPIRPDPKPAPRRPSPRRPLPRGTKQLRATKPMPRPTERMRQRGKRAWAAPSPAGIGRCPYRGPDCIAADRDAPLTWDHVMMRSVFPGPLRDDPRNRVPACSVCNGARGAGFKPPWLALPAGTRAFVLEQKSEVFARRYFAWIDQPTVI